MKLKTVALALLAVVAIAPAAQARKDYAKYPIEAVKALPEYQAQIGDFKFTFGGGIKGAALGTTSSRRATNGIGKSDEKACAWAMLSALLAIKNDAIARGGTSVQGIKSLTDSGLTDSAKEYECLSGATNSRVSITGTIVK